MKKQVKFIPKDSFSMGKILSIETEGFLNLPGLGNNDGKTEVLFIQDSDGCRLIPLQADVKKVYLEVTTICNFACITCIRNSWQDELGHMDWGIFEKILQGLRELPSLECVHIGGFGEPMSHPGIFDMLKAIKDTGLWTEMITNGSLLSSENINKILDIGLDMLFVSLDGPDEKEYNEIRQGADFNSVLSNLKNLNILKEQNQLNKPELGIEFVAMKSNYHKLPELINLANELKARSVIVTNVLPYNEELMDEILYDTDDTIPPFDNRYPLLLLAAKLPYMKLRTDRYCKFVEDKAMAINFRGQVSPCYALMHSYHCFVYGRKKEIIPYYLGNVTQSSLQEIWKDPAYINFRLAVKNFRFPSCTDCKYIEGCSMTDDNAMDCWGNSPSCAECLWSRQLIACP